MRKGLGPRVPGNREGGMGGYLGLATEDLVHSSLPNHCTQLCCGPYELWPDRCVNQGAKHIVISI